MRRYNEVLDSMDIAVSVAQDTYAFERQKRGQRSKPSFLFNTELGRITEEKYKELCRDLKCLDRSFPLIVVRDPRLIPSIKSSVIGLQIVSQNAQLLKHMASYKVYDILSDNLTLLNYIPTDKDIKIRNLILPGFHVNSIADFNNYQNQLKPLCNRFKIKSLYIVLKADFNLINSIPKFDNILNTNINFIIFLSQESAGNNFKMRNCIKENGNNLCAITNPLPDTLKAYNQFIYQEKGFNCFYRVNKLGHSTLYNIIYYINGKTVNSDIFYMNLFNISSIIGQI